MSAQSDEFLKELNKRFDFSLDKLPIKDLVTSISTQLLEAMQEVEDEIPGWKFGTVDISVTGNIKPGIDKVDGKHVIWFDVKEPSKHNQSQKITIPWKIYRTEIIEQEKTKEE